MATWATVKDYLLANYKCSPYREDGLKLTFDVGGGRSQVIIVQWAGKSVEQAAWVDFHSPIGRLTRVDLRKGVMRTTDFVVGGISSLGDIATLRSSMPLENLDRNEIESPLHTLLGIADQLESELTGADDY